MKQNHPTRGSTKSPRDRVGATQNVERTVCENSSRTVSGMIGSVRGSGVDNVRLRPVRVQGMCTTTDCSWTDRCAGRPNVFFLVVVRLPSGWFADETALAGRLRRSDDMRIRTIDIARALQRFIRSYGDRLSGDCLVLLAVGGEQRWATSPSSAQPRTAMRDLYALTAPQTRRGERDLSVRRARVCQHFAGE